MTPPSHSQHYTRSNHYNNSTVTTSSNSNRNRNRNRANSRQNSNGKQRQRMQNNQGPYPKQDVPIAIYEDSEDDLAKVLDMLELHLDTFLTKYFYFSANPAYQPINTIRDNTRTNEADMDDDIFAEVDQELNEDQSYCSICNETGISLSRICNCGDSDMYCFACIRHEILNGIISIFKSGHISRLNKNFKQQHTIAALLDSRTGRLCDIKLLNYIRKHSYLKCHKCKTCNIKYPNANEAVRHNIVLAALSQANYYQNEHWNCHEAVQEIISGNSSSNVNVIGYTPQIQITEYNNMIFRYYAYLDRPPVDDPEQATITYYIDPDCKYISAYHRPAAKSVAEYFNSQLAISIPQSYNDRTIKIPLVDEAGHMLVQSQLRQLCLDGIKETAQRIPHGQRPVIRGPIPEAKLADWQEQLKAAQQGI